MRRSAVRTSSRSRVTAQHRARRITRFALRCDYLESRRLLSIGQTAAAANVLASRSVPGDVVPSPATPTIAVSSDSSIAAKSASVGGPNNAQVGFLLSELDLLSPGAVATLAALTASPAANEFGVNLTIANQSVTVLNPVDTSVAAAITDTQVDADAYLVPSTTGLLEGYLGVPTAPTSQAVSMFSDLLGAGTAPDVVTSTNRPVISNTNAPGSSVTSMARNAGSNRGQLLLREVKIHSQSSSTDDEPLESRAPVEAPQAQPAPPGDKAPAPAPAPRPAPPGGQAPAPAPAPQPAPPEGAPPAAKPESAQPGGPAGAAASPQASVLPPTRASDIDAALDLIDVRVLTQSRAGDTEQPDSPAARADTSRSFSVLFGVAMVASGGHQLAMRTAARPRSHGRAVPRSLGAERPT